MDFISLIAIFAIIIGLFFAPSNKIEYFEKKIIAKISQKTDVIDITKLKRELDKKA